ncbi:hypothetical protein FHG87_009695 [Trinorchestia longiramus]|nr:hypothetical protein FHG87_009695 [Trinorchestia longiramus]
MRSYTRCGIHHCNLTSKQRSIGSLNFQKPLSGAQRRLCVQGDNQTVTSAHNHTSNNNHIGCRNTNSSNDNRTNNNNHTNSCTNNHTSSSNNNNNHTSVLSQGISWPLTQVSDKMRH